MSIEQLGDILTTEGIRRTARLAKTISKHDEVRKLISVLLDVLTTSIVSWDIAKEGDTLLSSEVPNLFEVVLVNRAEKDKDAEVTITLYEELLPAIAEIARIDFNHKKDSMEFRKSIALNILGFKTV